MQIKFFKSKNSFKKKSTEPKPDFYWKIIVLLVFIITLTSAGFGYYLFNQVQKDAFFEAQSANKKQLAEKEKIEKALDYFSEREKKSLDIINSFAPVVDPSL